MNVLRTQYAEVLNKSINKELSDLEMPNAKFKTFIDYSENGNYTENGLDDIEFLITTNIGDEAKPLIKIASGGEISRIMSETLEN